MDEQRTWLRARRKRRLRILAVMLSLCVLFTTYPDIPAALSVFASEEQAQAEVRYISGFTALPKEIREQTVPVGTELTELSLPDTLEAVVTERQSEDTAEKPEDDGKEEPGENDGKKPDGDTTGTEDQDGSTGETEEGGPSGTEQDNTETGGETGDQDTKTGDGVDAQPGADGESEETDETAGTDATDNGDTADIQKEENTGESAPAEEQGESEAKKENAPAEEQPESAPAQETHTVAMTEYHAENVISVQTLESTQTGAGAAGQTDAQENRVTIENVTWQSDPAYDGSVEGTYTFTAVLPEGYALSEGVSLPEISVTVQEELIKEIQAVTAAGELLNKILSDYFDGLSENEIYGAILAMDGDVFYSLIADYEELIAAMTDEDMADEKLQSVIDEIERGIADALERIPVEKPVLFQARAAAPNASDGIPMTRLDGSGEAFAYHSFRETTTFTPGVEYAFLNDIYDYETAVASLGSGAILRASANSNNSLKYIQFLNNDPSAEAAVYVDVVKKGRHFDYCQQGGLYAETNKRDPQEYRYYCDKGGAMNCGPYYAYTYETTRLTYKNVSASLKNVSGWGSSRSEDYIVMLTFEGKTVTLDEESYTVTAADSNIVTIVVTDNDGNTITTNFRGPVPIYYEGNGSGVTGLPETQLAESGQSATLSSVVPQRSGYAFAGWKDQTTGTIYPKGGTINLGNSLRKYLWAQWRDTQAPDFTCAGVNVLAGVADSDIKRAVVNALTITDNEPVSECTAEVTNMAVNLAKTAGKKNVTVTVTDKEGNKRTKSVEVMVMALALKFGAPGFTESTKKLSVKLESTGEDAITDTGFVWGIMTSPTLTLNNGKKSTMSPVRETGAVISVTAADIQKGVTYYARAYAVAGGVTYYSGETSFGLGQPAYGTFTITNNNNHTFTVTRSEGAEGTQTVYYRTVNGSAVGGTHFTHQADTLSFDDGETSKKITVSERGANTAYSGSPATAYSNANRTYSVELYRVVGGGTLGETKTAQRTMTAGSDYKVSRSVYTDEKNKVHIPLNDDGGEEIASVKESGKVAFLSNGNDKVNYHAESDFGTYYLGREAEYLRKTASGWYYRGDLRTRYDQTTTLHYYMGKKALEDKPYDATKDNPVSGVDGQLKSYAYELTAYSGSGHKTNMGFPGFYDKNQYVELGIDDTCYVYFGCNDYYGHVHEWYLVSLRSYAIVYDEKEPQLVAVAPMAGGVYKAGDSFTVSLIFDEIVDLTNSGESNLKNVVVETNWGSAIYKGGANTNVLYFTGTVGGDASGNLRVTKITNAGYIKDMCESKNEGTPTASKGGDTTASVDTAQPNFTLTSQGVSGGTGTVNVKVIADQTKTNALRYAWSDSASSMPVTGWVDATPAELASAKNNTSGLSLSIRKEAGSGNSNGKWYLHVIGAYNTTGATAYQYAEVDFGTKERPVAPAPAAPTLTASADNRSWATSRNISVTTTNAAGGTLQYRRAGTSAWTTLSLGSNGKASKTVTENGYYTFRLTVGEHILAQDVLVEKIDTQAPAAAVGTPVESGTNQTAKAGVYTKITLPITFSDSGSGVKTVEYQWTDTQTTPTSWTTLSLTADQKQSGTAEIPYTASEGSETNKCLHIKVTDNVDKYVTAKSAVYTMISQTAVDNYAPKITLTGAPTAWTNDTATLQWKLTGYEGKNYEVILPQPNGKTTRKTAPSGECWAMRNGTYTVTVRDLDYGGENTDSVTVEYIDTTAPAVSISGVSDSWQKTAQNVTFSISDSLSGVGKKYYKIVTSDQETPAEGLTELTSGSVSVEENGVWYVYYKIYDQAGDDARGREANKTEGFAGPIRIDDKTPTLTAAAPDQSVSKEAGLDVALEAVYGISGGTVKVNGSVISALGAAANDPENGNDITKNATYKIKAKGTYPFVLTGGSGKTASQSLTVYEAAFDQQGGTGTAPVQLVVKDGFLVQPDAPEKAGHTFKGWYTAAAGGEEWDFAAGKVTSDRTLYARWEANGYTVTFHKNDGIIANESNFTSYTYGTGLTLPTPTRAGYTFEGWYDNENCTGTAVKEISDTDTGDKEYWAKWTDNIAPVIGTLTYNYQPNNLLRWLIGKDSLIITVPVTEEGSGADEITCTVAPEGGAAAAKTEPVKNGEAKITVSVDFKGTISIVCTDKAGNTSTSVTVGADLGADGIIVEDNAPDITTDARTDYYDTAAAVNVTVKDDTDNTVTAGIASVTYQVGDDTAKSVTASASALQSEVTFTIPASEIPTGITEITVTAADNAGNTATKSFTVKVKGPEKKPDAEIDYRQEELTGLVPGGSYTIDGTAYTADGEGRIPIKEDWFNSTVSIIRKGNGSGITDSPAQSLSVPARPAAPGTPELSTRDDKSITLKTILNAQYRLADGTDNWQDSTAFTGLAQKTVYRFRAYYPATDTSFASRESDEAQIATMPTAPTPDKLRIGYVTETFTLTDGIEAFADAGCTSSVTAGSVTAYMGQTIYIRYPENGSIPASLTTAVPIPARPAKPSPGKEDASYPAAADGAITGLTPGTTYEYRVKDTDGNFGAWKTATPSGTKIENLPAGDYEVRVKAVETGNASFQSEAAAVTIGATPATKYETPKIRIDYPAETLTGFVPGAKYTIGSDTITAGADGTLPIKKEWFGTILSITRNGNDKDKLDSDPQSLPIPARPAKPTPTGVDVSTAGGTGKLTGLTAGTAYEVSTDGGKTWASHTADGSGQITGLLPGTYVVRVKAGTDHFVSEPSDSVKIGAYQIKVTFMVDGAKYREVSVDYGAALTDIPPVPAKDNAIGAWCMDEQGTTPAVFTNITADMTVYAVYTTAYTVTLQTGTGYTLSAQGDSESPVKEGGSFTFRFALADGYQQNADFAVKVNGVKVELTAQEPYTYTITDIRENKTVTVEGVGKKPSGKPADGGDKEEDPKPEPEDPSPKPEDTDPENPAPKPPAAPPAKPTSPAPAPDETSPAEKQPEGRPGTTPQQKENAEPEKTGEPEEEPGTEAGTPRPDGTDSGQTTGTPAKQAEVKIGNGTVIVTVVCEEEKCAAAVSDTEAVVKAVLTTEQQELVKCGETIEIRIDVTDISDRVPGQDKEVIESGTEAYREEVPGLVLGMYVDISMFVKIGGGDWNAITETDEPIEVVVNIPEKLLSDNREFYIIRAHNGEYTFMDDMDDASDTITVSTDLFSSYAIAYVETEGGADSGAKCGLCHICPTFLGICYFIWLAFIIAVIAIVVFVVLHRKKEEEKKERNS